MVLNLLSNSADFLLSVLLIKYEMQFHFPTTENSKIIFSTLFNNLCSQKIRVKISYYEHYKPETMTKRQNHKELL